MAEDIAKLVEESYVGQVSRACWAKMLDKRAAAYIAALQATGKLPIFTRVSAILSEHFGVTISTAPIGKHFRGTCSCARKP